MDRRHIDENHLVARYLADQLTDDELESFEAYLREHPELVREIEAAARFKVGLATLAAKRELDATIQGRGSDWRARAFALAAAVAVMAIGIAFWFSRGPSPGPMLAASAQSLVDAAGRALPTTEAHVILRARSTDPNDAVVELPRESSAIELRVLPEYPAAGDTYRVRVLQRLDDDTERKLGELSGLRPAEDGFLAVYLRSDSMSPGIYTLKILSDSDSDAPGSDYSIRVIAAPADRQLGL